MSQVLWLSVSNNSLSNKLNKYKKIKEKFNTHFNDSLLSDNKVKKSTNIVIDDNKIILEKINNYIDLIKKKKYHFHQKMS